MTSTIETTTERSDPDVFVVAARTADLAEYGIVTHADINGSGAGLTAQAAHSAAIGECVERYACCVLDPDDLIVGSFRELADAGYRIIPPEEWALFDPTQLTQVPFAPFLTETRIAWVPAEKLTRYEENLIPACLVYLGSREFLTRDGAEIIAPALSTGAACATSRAEALLKGLCEAVERDAFIIGWRNRLPWPAIVIDPKNSLHEVFEERFVRPGLEFNLFLTTLDLGIPSIFGYVRDARRNPPAIFVGGAAHPDIEHAVLKTLLELAQGLKWWDFLNEESFPIEPGFGNVRSFRDRARLYALNDMRHAFDFLSQTSEPVPLSSFNSASGGVRTDTLHRSRQLLADHGLEILALDLTPADIAECGLYVVKVVVSQLEAIEGDTRFPFLGGFRWREVPIRLGFGQAVDISTINPYPHPYP